MNKLYEVHGIKRRASSFNTERIDHIYEDPLISNTRFHLLDTSKPDGAPRKLLSVARLKNLGWGSSVGFKEGLAHTYGWFLANDKHLRES